MISIGTWINTGTDLLQILVGEEFERLGKVNEYRNDNSTNVHRLTVGCSSLALAMNI